MAILPFTHASHPVSSILRSSLNHFIVNRDRILLCQMWNPQRTNPVQTLSDLYLLPLLTSLFEEKQYLVSDHFNISTFLTFMAHSFLYCYFILHSLWIFYTVYFQHNPPLFLYICQRPYSLNTSYILYTINNISIFIDLQSFNVWTFLSRIWYSYSLLHK